MFHSVEFRAHCHATEEEARVDRAFRALCPEGTIETERTEGHHGNPILLKRLRIQKDDAIAAFWRRVKDAGLLDRIIEQGLAEAGRFMVLQVTILDRPGRLANVLECVARAEANVLEVYHHRKGLHLPVGQVEVELLLETRDAAHGEGVLASFAGAGYRKLEPEAAAAPIASVHRFVSGEAAARA
jgi:hypothetical protein